MLSRARRSGPRGGTEEGTWSISRATRVTYGGVGHLIG
ncbi:hypothetical protein ATKI12_6749 [Kitasatospora sp. Ki12]